MPVDLHPDVAELADLVEKWARMMRSYHGDTHWVRWLEKDIRSLRNSDYQGVEHLLSAFGGMGSIIDFTLVPETGNWFSRIHKRLTNRRYTRLVNRVYALASRLKRERAT